MGPEGILPLHAVIQPPQAVLAVRDIGADKEEGPVFERDDASLCVVLGNAEAVTDRQGRMTRIDGRAGVAFLFGVIPVGLIAEEFHIYLTFLQFGLLQADKVGIEAAEDVGKALAGHGPQAVHIPGDKFHTIPKSRWRLPWCP